MSRTASRSWLGELKRRASHLWALKTLGITAWTWLFFIGYFYLLRHPRSAPFVMPLTALDDWIGFHPAAMLPYVSLWLYVGIAPALQRSFAELAVYGLWVGGLCVAGLLLFCFWPTVVPPQHLGHVSDFPGFSVLRGVDAAGNACPSMHVAASMFSALCLDDVLRRMRAPQMLRVLNALWFAAIAYSTLAIKQHVALDAAAGALLGLAFGLPSLRYRPGGRLGAPDIIRPS